MRQELVLWGVGLVIGLAVLVIVLGEVIERLQQQGNPFAKGLRQVRHIVLPILALLLALRQVVGIAGASEAMCIIETLFWVTVVYTGLTLLSNLVQLGQHHTNLWVNKTPTLFFALMRAAIVLIIAYHVISDVWEINISKLFTAVGAWAHWLSRLPSRTPSAIWFQAFSCWRIAPFELETG